MISVIMSTYNETVFEVKRSIDSILSQTYQDIELIIVCDNPNNLSVVKYLRDITDLRVRVYFNSENQGLVYCLNYALSKVTGNYVARMDADDYCDKDRLNNQLNYLVSHNYDLVGSWISLVNEKGSVIGKTVYPTSDRSIRSKLKHFNCLAHPTWLGKKEIFDELNGYRSIDYCEDYDFLLRLRSKAYRIGNLPEYSLNYQIRSTSITRGHLSEQKVRTLFLAHLKNENLLDIEQINRYFNTEKYYRKVSHYDKYFTYYNNLKQGKIGSVFVLLFNRITYISIFYKLWLRLIRIEETSKLSKK